MPTALWILLSSQFDALATLYALSLGATEANPLMAQALAWGPGWFLLIKTYLVVLGVFLLYRNRHHRLARWGLAFLATLYTALAVYHVTLW